ncbi:PAS domain-containing protein [Candidatus Desantisbacteria bacterium]|nr:PAS domain-containing protein [Candidatus Desantisbacteria bacterium]
MSQKFFENKKEITLLFKSLENSYDGILALDIDYKILYANSAIKKMFGLPLRDLIGSTAEIILTKNCLKQIKEKVLKNKTWEGEFCIKQKKGGDLFVWIKAALVKNKISSRILLLFHDINEW